MASNSPSPIVTGWAASFRCALAGVVVIFRSQDIARFEAIATVAVVGLGRDHKLSALEWCARLFAIALVLTTDAMNTSIETIVDRVSPEFHPLAGRAKDVASGAVLIAAIGSIAIGL